MRRRLVCTACLLTIVAVVASVVMSVGLELYERELKWRGGLAMSRFTTIAHWPPAESDPQPVIAPWALTDEELHEVREALAHRAKQWKRSIVSMAHSGREDEAMVLAERALILRSARTKLGAPPEDA